MLLRPLLQPDAVWLDQPNSRRIAGSALTAALGLAAYGFSVGFWRSPLMGVYVAIKMPMLIACTLTCNGLLNGLRVGAHVVRANLHFRRRDGRELRNGKLYDRHRADDHQEERDHHRDDGTVNEKL